MSRVPIIIPTLNRINHLKACVESLKKNQLAKETELYISVDYPPTEKYRNGYPEVCEYVSQIEGFSDIHVFIQSTNLGPAANADFLRAEARKHHECFFYTEDDNVFSELILEYMNTALEYYRYHPGVMAVSAAADTFYTNYKKCSVYFRKRFSAWGYAMWFAWKDQIDEWIKHGYEADLTSSFSNRARLLWLNTEAYCCYAQDLLREIPAMRNEYDELVYMDDVTNIYAIVNHKCTVYPVQRLVLNNGFDGSGVNCGTIQGYAGNPIEEMGSFVVRERGVRWVSMASFLYEACRHPQPMKRIFRSLLIVGARKMFNDMQFLKFQRKIQSIHHKG